MNDKDGDAFHRNIVLTQCLEKHTQQHLILAPKYTVDSSRVMYTTCPKEVPARVNT
jgi:hypothetical protein